MKYAVCVLRPKDHPEVQAFDHIALAVHHGLLKLGHDSVLGHDPTRKQILFGFHLAPLVPSEIVVDADKDVIYNLEPLSTESPAVGPKQLKFIRECGFEVWDYDRHNVLAWATHGIDAKHVPIGHVPELERIELLPEEDRDIDVLFVGSLSNRRMAVVGLLGNRVTYGFGFYGITLDYLLARAKIVLNLHYYPNTPLEQVRLSYLLANGCFVVSERSDDLDEDREWAAGMVFGDYDVLDDICLSWLERPDARHTVAEIGRQTIRNRPMDAYLRERVGQAVAAHA